MIDADPVEYDVNELQKIAKLMAVDEIHLFDDQEFIYESGSAPKYFGYNFDSGADGYFKPMLKNNR